MTRLARSIVAAFALLGFSAAADASVIVYSAGVQKGVAEALDFVAGSSAPVTIELLTNPTRARIHVDVSGAFLSGINPGTGVKVYGSSGAVTVGVDTVAVTMDSEWDTLAEIESHVGGFNILTSTELANLAALDALIGADVLTSTRSLVTSIVAGTGVAVDRSSGPVTVSVSSSVVMVSTFSRSTAQTGDVASVVTSTVGATDASYTVSSNLNVTAYTAGTQTVTCVYTDETNTSRTLTFTFTNLTGTLLTAIGATGPYESFPLHIRCKAATTITIKSTGSIWVGTYNVEGVIIRLS